MILVVFEIFKFGDQNAYIGRRYGEGFNLKASKPCALFSQYPKIAIWRTFLDSKK